MMGRARRIGLGALALAAICANASAARADGFIIIEQPPTPRPVPHRHEFFPLAVKHHDVTVAIKDGVAVTTVDQTFFNPNPTQLEGTYIFPLPSDATVSQFSMWMDGREVQGEVLDRDKARSIYEGIVRKMQDPALLEYIGRGAFRARVFPIPARGDKRVKLTYSQVLPKSGPLRRYSYPLNTEKFSSAPLQRVTVRCRIESSAGAVRNVYSPTHAVEVVPKADGVVEAVHERTDVRPDKDFALYYATSDADVELSLLSYRDHDGGYFVALISPYGEDRDVAPIPKDVVFCLDTSGSMAGEKMEQAKTALTQAIGRLGDADRFAIVDFSTEVRAMGEQLLAADEAGRKKATAYVAGLNARGGTAIHDAIVRSLAYGDGGARPFFVVFITDGQPTIGPSKPDEILKAAADRRRGNERLFVLGVGADVNTHLLDALAEKNRGDRDYVLPEEDLEVKVSAFVDKIAYPVLADVEVSLGAEGVRDVYPKRVGDLFRGSQVVVTGRYRDDGPVAITLRGKRGEETIERVVEGAFRADESNEFASRLWAKRKIGFLLDAMRMSGESDEVRNEIIFLAKKFGIVTPYTSYLVVEDAVAASAPRGDGRSGQWNGPGGGRPGQSGAPQGGENRRVVLVPRDPDAPAGAPAPEPTMGDQAFNDALRRHAEQSQGRSSDLARGLRESSGEESLGATRVSGALRRVERPGEDAEAEKGGYSYGRLAEAPAAADKARDGLGFGGGSGAAPKADTATATPADRPSMLETAGARALVRRVGGRTFYRRGDVWVDADAREKGVDVVRVVYLSAEYFELISKDVKIAAFLAIGDRVELMWEGKLYRIVKA